MDISGNIDQFELLEEKIDHLIDSIESLKKEKEALSEKAQIQEEKLSDLKGQIENLNSSRDSAKKRIISILEKIEQVDI